MVTGPHAELPPDKDQNTQTSGLTSTLLTTTDAANYLKIKPTTLEQNRWKGTGPKFCKIGRNVRYRLIDLEAYASERVYGSTTEARQGA